MRITIQPQLTLVEPLINHSHAEELLQMGEIIDESPRIAELIHGDLIYGLDNPETGRKGMMTADQVFRVITIMQMNGFSYEELAYR